MSSATTTNSAPGGGNAGPYNNTTNQSTGNGGSTGETSSTGAAKYPALRIARQQLQMMQMDRVARPDAQMVQFRNELFLLR